MLISDLDTLSNVTLKYTLTSTVVIYTHHSFVALFSIEKFCNHDTILLCCIVGKWVWSTNLTSMHISIDIRQ